MNIKINTDILQDTDNDILSKCLFGSKMCQIDNSNSDSDIMYIVKNIKHVPFYTHHQLQCKLYKNKIHESDIIITTLDQFIMNTLNGDSTINFEIIMSNNLNGKLSFITKYKDLFINYNIILSYLGMAKRDIKLLDKSNNKHKKIVHIYRGIETAKYLLFNDSVTSLNEVYNKVKEYNQVLDINNIDLTIFKNEIDNLRNELNNKLENNLIHKIYDLNRYKEFLNEYYKVYNLEFENNTFEEIITDYFLKYTTLDVQY